MQEINTKHITLDPIDIPVFRKAGISADMLRLDKIHPVISGNKWFKLKFYLEDFIKSGKKEIVTFGGAWSNHIIATAAACQQLQIPVTGIIRGEESSRLSQTLQDALGYGMKLRFISREQYKEKLMPEDLPANDYYIIPEGGYGQLGMKGAATILDLINKSDYSHICCAAGTGTMAAGLLHAAAPKQILLVISVLKNFLELEKSIFSLRPESTAGLEINHHYHFGGYAKCKPELIQFMNDFFRQTSIPSDFVYSAKLFYAITDLAAKKYFPHNSRVLIIHCGGLQGNTSLEKGTLIF